MCAETVKAKAKICRFCRHEFAPLSTISESNDELQEEERIGIFVDSNSGTSTFDPDEEVDDWAERQQEKALQRIRARDERRAATRQANEESKSCLRCRKPTVRTHSEAENPGTSCLLLVIGLCFAPLLIGIPVVLYALALGSKKRVVRRCSSCGASQ